MSKILNNQLLQKFLIAAGEKLEGEWLLAGGTLLPAVGIDLRPTVDIDLLGLGKKEAAQSLELMELAESLGLPVEAVNQAAAFFLKQVGYKKEDLLPLHKGPKATIFRPSLELYWKLKMGRLTETDQQDCEHYLTACVNAGDSINRERIAAYIQSVLTNEKSPDKCNRLKALLSLV